MTIIEFGGYHDVHDQPSASPKPVGVRRPQGEHQTLKVILPVVKDENGDIIDGYQRVRVCNELGITDYPAPTLRGRTEDDKRDHSLIRNLVRRRLNQQQMRKLIAAELKRTPDLSETGSPRSSGQRTRPSLRCVTN